MHTFVIWAKTGMIGFVGLCFVLFGATWFMGKPNTTREKVLSPDEPRSKWEYF